MSTSEVLNVSYETTRLPSGLRILTVPMKHFESVGVALWVGTGSRYESDREAGIAHFLEHMVFKGTPQRTSRQIRLEIEGVGGLLNAFTGEEHTCFFTKLLKPHLKLGLEVLSDMILNARLAPEDTSKERTVILEEIKMYQDIPSHCVHEEMSKMLWPNHPLGRPISGSYESVARLGTRELEAFKKRYYHASNILVSVSGDVDHQQIVRWVETLFASQRKSLLTPFKKAKALQKKPVVSLLDKKTEQTHFVLGMHTFSRYHPDRYKLALLNVILGANMSSRLFEVVREKRGLAYEIRSSLGFYRDAGYLTISAGVENSKAVETLRVVMEELSKIRRNGVQISELRRAKDYFHSQLRMALEDTLDHLLWAGERLLDSNHLPDLNTISRAVEKISREHVQDVAEKIFLERNLNLALIGSEVRGDHAKFQNLLAFNQ